MLLLIGLCLSLVATSEDGARIDALEKRVQRLEESSGETEPEERGTPFRAPGVPARFGRPGWTDRLTIGGYGEIHANLGEGPSHDQMDIHRFVLYFGYRFEDALQLNSEIEIEHAFVSDDDGEIAIEQLTLDGSIDRSFNVRVGRMLVPVGLVNRKHEPTTFNGVERPLFSTVIVPSTWFADGAGFFGRLAPEFEYELYVVSGLDGSRFSATNGIRDGRLKERPSLNEPAVTGRIDLRPLIRRNAAGQSLRLGFSGYAGGLDNGDQGQDPDINGELVMGAVDFEYTLGIVDLRGAGAYQKITGTRAIGNGVASDLYGYFVEVGFHVLPESCRTGRLSQADLVLFARLDDVDTQHELRSGVASNRAGDRTEITLGFTWFFDPSLVLKGDVQIRDDDRRGDLPALVNLGVGWVF
ncbi:MAG: hypothetical protein KDC38_12760 [Planctomycetes bacterium]|nr:hypothetical protein [Planctomycetota bacterium]